jgi:hypothetical protein
LASQNRHNKGVIYQNRHSKGLSAKFKQFRPAFVAKIVQIKDLWRLKSQAPEIRGFRCFWFYFIKRDKTNGQVFSVAQVTDFGLLVGISTILGT